MSDAIGMAVLGVLCFTMAGVFAYEAGVKKGRDQYACELVREFDKQNILGGGWIKRWPQCSMEKRP